MQDRRQRLAVMILALGLFVLAYEAIQTGGLMESSVYFVGLPGLLAVVVTLGTSPHSAEGIVLKTLTIALLLSAFVLHACAVCLLFAAPLFYAVAIACVGVVRLARRFVRRGAPLASIALLPAVLVAGGTQPHPASVQSVTVVRAVAAPASSVEGALAAAPRFDRARPVLLHRVGYRASGSGLAVGAQRRIAVSIPGEGHGTLDLVVRRRAPGVVVFGVARDDSPVAEWVRLRRATVHWQATGPRTTRVEWSLAFDCLLAPAWYFAPILRFEARLAAGYLVDTVATPR